MTDTYKVNAPDSAKGKVPNQIVERSNATVHDQAGELNRELGSNYSVRVDEQNKSVSVLEFIRD